MPNNLLYYSNVRNGSEAAIRTDQLTIFPKKVPQRSGAQGRNRTTDTVIFSHVLYQLSYLGSRIRVDSPLERSAP